MVPPVSVYVRPHRGVSSVVLDFGERLQCADVQTTDCVFRCAVRLQHDLSWRALPVETISRSFDLLLPDYCGWGSNGRSFRGASGAVYFWGLLRTALWPAALCGTAACGLDDGP